MLWFALREQKSLHGLKFRRQRPIEAYIVDFACMQAKLIIEIDGWSHESSMQYDQKRTDKLQALGFVVIRFSNQEVHENCVGVVTAIVEQALARLTPPHERCRVHTPPSRGGD